MNITPVSFGSRYGSVVLPREIREAYPEFKPYGDDNKIIRYSCDGSDYRYPITNGFLRTQIVELLRSKAAELAYMANELEEVGEEQSDQRSHVII